jgi:hypothetical protein
LLQILLGAAGPIAASAAAGRRIAPRLDFALRFALGAAAVSYAAFLAVALHLATPFAYALLLTVPLALFRLERPSRSMLVLLPWIAYLSIHALAPEIQSDAIGYHLGLVSGWLRDANFLDQTGHYDVMPHGLELLFTPAAAIGGYPAAKLVHFAFLLATIPLIASTIAALELDRALALPATVLYLAAPAAAASGTCAYNDAALAFFTLAAFRLSLSRHEVFAGIAAGFCYAVKMTGGVILLYLLARRQWKAILVAAIAAVPWIARAWWLTGNPFAPLFNSLFPNPHFHLSTELTLRDYLTSYDTSASVLWREWTIGGGATQGLLGPAFLLLPVALLALRRESGRKLALAGSIAAFPAVFNLGTRFLIPAAPFAAILIAMALMPRLAWAAALLQLIACAPGVIDRWSDHNAWRLRGFPWQAALGIEHEADYLRRVSNYAAAEMINAHLAPGDRLLDLAGLPYAYIDVPVHGNWQYASADRAAGALDLAARSSRTLCYTATASWPAAQFDAVRIEQTADGPEPWSFQEIALLHNGRDLFPSANWMLHASTNQSELALAFDRNSASRWQTWQQRRAAMWVEVEFPSPTAVDGIRLLAPMAENNARYRILGRAGGTWSPLSDAPHRRYWTAISLRAQAGRYLRRQGYTHVVFPAAGDGYAPAGRAVEVRAADWGLRLVANDHGLFLYTHSTATTPAR